MQKLKLGIIGLSEGNGHPYSWAAICNGYNKKFMDSCPFPVIPQYLSRQKYPEDFIENALITHIWTQDKCCSEHIANSSNIKNVVEYYEDMIGEVDGILLARDDAENHLEMSRAFIEAGLPIYIDKPLAFNIETAKQIYSLEKYEGQIFSCSAMYYAKEVKEVIEEIKNIGKIKYIDACVMKKWTTYSPHILDPILRIIGGENEIISIVKEKIVDSRIMHIKFTNEVYSTLSAHGNTACPIIIRIFGEEGYEEIIIKDTFYAFRETLKAFIESVHSKKSPIKRTHVLDVVRLIEEGM